MVEQALHQLWSDPKERPFQTQLLQAATKRCTEIAACLTVGR